MYGVHKSKGLEYVPGQLKFELVNEAADKGPLPGRVGDGEGPVPGVRNKTPFAGDTEESSAGGGWACAEEGFTRKGKSAGAGRGGKGDGARVNAELGGDRVEGIHAGGR